MTARFFTVSDVDAMIPWLDTCMRRIAGIRCWMRAAYVRLDAVGVAPIRIDFPIPGDAPLAVRRDLEDLRLGVEQLREDVARLLELGCVVRSLDLGRLDFRARHVDRDVYLCWQLGEPQLLWWHELDEGIEGRKPIDELPAAARVPGAMQGSSG